MGAGSSLKAVSSADRYFIEFRVKPETITINGIEVPAPMRVAPPKGETYWFVCFSSGGGPYGHTTPTRWAGDRYELDRLKQARCHLTQEGAQQHARALILASGGEV